MRPAQKSPTHVLISSLRFTLLLIIQIGLYRENSKGLVLSISYSFFYCQNYNISSSSGFHQSIVYYCNISNFIQAVSDNIIADYFSVTQILLTILTETNVIGIFVSLSKIDNNNWNKVLSSGFNTKISSSTFHHNSPEVRLQVRIRYLLIADS